MPSLLAKHALPTVLDWELGKREPQEGEREEENLVTDLLKKGCSSL